MTNSNYQSSKSFGLIVLFLITILWGATFVVVKGALSDISPLFFNAIRFTIASLVLLPFIIKRRQYLTKPAVISGLFLGVMLFLGFATQTTGLRYTTATKSGFITGSLVVIVPILQTLLEKRRPTKGAILGTVLVFIGIIFLSSGGNSIVDFLTNIGNDFNIGDFLTLLCAIFFSIQIVYIDIISPKYDLLSLVFLQLAVTAVLSFLTTFFFSFSSLESFSVNIGNNLIMALIYTSLIATLFTFIMQMKYQKIVSPTKAGIIYSFEPIFASVLAFFVLSEKISNFGLIGMAIMFLGLITSEVYDNLVKKNGNKNRKSGDTG